MTYVPFPVDPNGMPLWLLPNKTYDLFKKETSLFII